MESICSWFEQQVELTPSRIAVKFKNQSLTYRKLNNRANQLANYIKKQKIKHGSLIGLSVDRSIDLIICIIGILKAGCAYVPIDPSYPENRINFMLTDTLVSLLITQAHTKHKFTELKVKTIVIDEEQYSIYKEDTQNPLESISSRDLAYVIYTSGSTGKPKGVMIPHGNIISLFKAIKKIYDFNKNDIWTLFHSFAFDFSVFEIWGALFNGSKLVIVSYLESRSPELLHKLLIEEKITVINQTPSAFQQLLTYENSLSTIKNSFLRYIIFCGEELKPSFLRYWHAKYDLKKPKLMNMYGPAEATVFSSYHKIDEHFFKSSKSNIGKPLLGWQIYILDHKLKLVKHKQKGEIYISGAGLATGYLNRPTLTKERFINNPFSNNPADILYRTGDLGRYLENGDIEFLGRVDDQVKIRGYRIELGEIETVLCNHPLVNQAVVAVSKGKSLIAYVISNFGKQKEEKLERDVVSRWQKIYQEIYEQNIKVENAIFNISGWNSSYTGTPISKEEMLEWVNNVVTRILELNPKKVLEIGCGTGLLLYRIAPHCQEYLGTDITNESVSFIRQLKSNNKKLQHVNVLQKEAIDFKEIPKSHFDIIIINSVIQHFPNLDYLFDVIKSCAEIIKPGGKIFLGDIRNFNLLKAYHTSVKLHKAAKHTSKESLCRQIEEAFNNEEELTISTNFFLNLKKKLPRIRHVQIKPKEGKFHNELNKFRYEVILHTEEVEKQNIDWVDWSKNKLSLNDINNVLKEQPQFFGLKNVKNSRLRIENQTLNWLESNDALLDIQEFEKFLIDCEFNDVDPRDLFELGNILQYSVELSWSSNYKDGSYDVVFKSKKNSCKHINFEVADEKVEEQLFANNPLHIETTKNLIHKLRTFLSQKLPSYMVPNSFFVVEKFPLNKNKKVDKKALLKISSGKREIETPYVAPQVDLERKLAEIWGELLQVNKIGINDDFLYLGGNSLLATQVIVRIRDIFKIDLPIRSLFEFPTIKELSAYIKKLQRQKKDTTIPLISHIKRSQKPDLSFAQQRLWFLEQLLPDSGVYNIPISFLLTGNLNKHVLVKSFNKLIERHEVLRTTIAEFKDRPYQKIKSSCNFYLKTIDLSSYGSKQHQVVEQYIQKFSFAPFNLSEGPVIRGMLLKLNSQETILTIVVHHIACDGWSIEILLKEIGILYNNYLKKQEPILPKLSVQYANFALWQRQWLKEQILNKQLKYWQERLYDAPDFLKIYTDKPRPQEQSYKGAIHRYFLSKELRDRLRHLEQTTKSTLFMILLSAFQILLYRYTNQEKIIVGSPIANRHYSEIENLIGFFVNTLAFRSDFSRDIKFNDFLKQVKKTSLEAYENQDIPFEYLVYHLKVKRSLSYHPIFQVMFVLQNMQQELLELNGLKVDPIEPKTLVSKFDLALNVQESSRGLSLEFEYATDLFLEETIVRMAKNFECLLNSILENSECTIGKLKIVSKEESDILINKWNNTYQEFPQYKCIHQLFEEQVERSPNAIAVMYEDTE